MQRSHDSAHLNIGSELYVTNTLPVCSILSVLYKALSPPSRTSTAPVSPAKPSALQVIPPTRHTASSVCCHQGGDCGVSRRGPADRRTASYIRLSGSSTLSRLSPSSLLPHAPLNSDPLTLHTHTHTHTHTHQSPCTALD